MFPRQREIDTRCAPRALTVALADRMRGAGMPALDEPSATVYVDDLRCGLLLLMKEGTP